MLVTWVTDILFLLNLLTNYSPKWLAIYCLIGNNTFPQNMMYDSLYRDNTTIKSLKFDESSESNSSSGGGVGHGVIHDRNQVTINDGNICVGAESYVDTSCMIQNSSYLHYKYLNKKWKIRILMLI